MSGYNPATVPPEKREYNEFFCVFTPFFNLARGDSFVAAMFDIERARASWLDSDKADMYLKYFIKKSPKDAENLMYEKVPIENREGWFVIRVRQPRYA